MAVTKEQVTELYVATFNRAPDASGLNYWVNSGLTIEEIAESFFLAPETQEKYPEGTTDEVFVTTIYQNVFNREPDEDGLAFWVGEGGLGGGVPRSEMILAVIGGAQNDDAEILANKTEVGLYFADELGLGGDGPFYLTDVTADDATVDAAKAAADALVPVVPPVEGDTFTLTAGIDSGADFTGTANNDEFDAPIVQNPWAGGVSNSLSTADRLDGGAGYDTLHAELVPEFYGVTGDNQLDIQPRIQRIEDIKFEAMDVSSAFNNGAIIVDAKNIKDVDKIGSYFSDADLMIENLTTLTSDGVARNTEDITITMDHTDNFNSDGDASDLTVYFDEDYLLAGQETAGASLLIRMINAFANVTGGNPIEGFTSIVFAVGDTEVTVNVESISADTTLDYTTAYDAVVDAINAQLVADGFSDVTASREPLTPAVFSIEIGDYGVGESAGVYHPILLTNQGDEELTGIKFGQTRLNYDTDINNTFDPEPPVISDIPLSINIDLHKVGRDNDGGDLFIGGKHTEGIPDFHVDVLGDATKPSNLGYLGTNIDDLENVYISTHADYVDSETFASLTIRDGFGSWDYGSEATLDLVDADDFLGDLTLGSDTAINNLVTLTAMGGGDITFNGVNTGNTNNVVSTGAGADVITITDANNLQVSTGGGSDFIDLTVAGASKVDAGAGDDTVILTGGGRARVDGGAGDDVILGDNVSITSNAGAGNDVTYVDNTGGMAASLFDLNALRQADEDDNLSFGFLFDRTVTVTVNGDQGINTQLAAQYTDGFEAEAVIGAADFDRLTTKADLIAAIQAAVENSDVLSSLVKVDDDGFITSLIDGDNMSVEIHIGESDWTTKDVATLQSEYRTVQRDSSLEVADNYAEISSAQVLADGSDSEAVNSNTVTLSAGVDTVVLSTQVDAVDTLVFDGAFDTAYVVNFTEGEDVLNFSAYLDGQFSPSGSVESRAYIPVTSESDTELSANEINIQTFDGNNNVEEFADLNAGNLLDLIDFSTELYTNTKSNIELVNGDGSAIVMIQNDENLGEYKVFNVSFDGTDDDFELSDSDISLIGIVDFGADIADSVDNGVVIVPGDDDDDDDDTIAVDQDLVAVDGEAEIFTYQIDSSTGDVVSLAGGDWTITGFNVAEDAIVFEDVAAGTITTETFVDGVVVSESGIFDLTNIIFDADSEGDAYQLTLAGVVDQTLDTVDFTVA